MKIIKKDDIKPWLKEMSSQAKLIMAARNDEDMLIYTPYRETLDPVLEGIPRLSAKEVVFPQTQTLLEFRHVSTGGDDKQLTVQAPIDTSETIVFGMKPCDAAGIAIIEKTFTQGPYQDPYLIARREHTTLIAISCSTPPRATCFCSSVKGGPAGTAGADLLLTPLAGDLLFAEAITQKGEDLLVSDFFSPAETKDKEAAGQVKQRAEAKMADRPKFGDMKKTAKKLEEIFLSDYWRQTAAACIGCKICTFLCPTCYCFNISDEMGACEGKRIRTWDACMSCQYTLEASGHNPRANQSQRYRNRINHKFSYLINNSGVIGCVGCGRCIRHCPVSLDIRKVVKNAQQL